MCIRICGILITLIGIAGLVVPFMPSILLIIVGLLMTFSGRYHMIRKMLPEKIPAFAAYFYNAVPAKFFTPHYAIVAGEMDLRPGQTLLDLGTGPGLLPIQIAQRFPGAHVIGIDLSEKMIELAYKHLRDTKYDIRNTTLEFKVMDANKLAFGDESIDVIVSTGAFHHWKNPAQIFDEIYRCLKRGGAAFIYDGYAGASDEAIDSGIKRLFWILPTHSMVRARHGFEKPFRVSLLHRVPRRLGKDLA